MSAKQRGVLCVFAAAVLYSIGGLCIKVIPWNGMSINGARTAVALVVIGLYLWAIRHKPRMNRWVLLGALAVCGTNILFSIANKMTTAANAIVLQFTAPHLRDGVHRHLLPAQAGKAGSGDLRGRAGRHPVLLCGQPFRWRDGGERAGPHLRDLLRRCVHDERHAGGGRHQLGLLGRCIQRGGGTLKARGLIAQVTNEEEISKMINEGKAVFYIGFDPTADSLHGGHFMALCLMKRLQMAGNRPIALIGGGTGYIGDPSGRTDMRP